MDSPGATLLRGLLEVFLLESLEKQPKHGYAILKELAEAFGAEPNRNRLYPLLARFVKDGLVREVTDATGGRTLYALTDDGQESLRRYRRLPLAFRETLRRVWSTPLAPDAPGAPRAADGKEPPTTPPPTAAAADRAAEPTTPHVLSAPDVASGEKAFRIPVQTPVGPTPTTYGDHLPYPCPDATVDLSKNVRTGNLSLRLTGCPMGRYEYCPQCPVFESVASMRKLVFSV